MGFFPEWPRPLLVMSQKNERGVALLTELIARRLQFLFKSARQVYQRYESVFPVLFFVGGFAWDSLTLTRIDRLSDNLILALYLLVVSACVVLINLSRSHYFSRPVREKYSPWFVLGAQFCLGGLFSAYVVFYFQSASFSKTFLFVGLLFLLMVANEFLEDRLNNLLLQMTLLFLATMAFFTFLIPMVLKQMGWGSYLAAGLLAYGWCFGLVHLLRNRWLAATARDYRNVLAVNAVLLVLMIVLYAANFVPPVPLSLKEGGVFHRVQRQGERFLLYMEAPRWYQVWRTDDDPFRLAPGDTVFCFTAVFAPTRLREAVRHRWQYRQPNGTWVTTDELSFQIVGGRQGGYRGYTFKRNIRPGRWRVDVVTGEGLILGRIGFTVNAVPEQPRRWKVKVR